MLTRRLLFALALLPSGGIASAADIMVPPASGAYVNVCADSGVLARIASRFAWAERNTWHRGFVMQSIENPRPSGHPYYEPGLVARDFAGQTRHWCLLPDHGQHPTVKQAAEILGLDPVLDVRLDLGEGANALAVLPVLQAMLGLVTTAPTHPAMAEPAGD